MQEIHLHPEELYGRPLVLQYVQQLKAQSTKFTLIDIGASWNPFCPELLTHTFDKFPTQLENVHTFIGDINSYESWQLIFDHVKQHGKFTFCNCTHTLEDISYPQAVLKYMPQIAQEGFIAVPSKYWELQRRDKFRGGHHHRWIFDHNDHELIAYPKVNLIDDINYYPNNLLIEQHAHLELRIHWKHDINWRVINDDYLGPTFEEVRSWYQNLIP
jgi:hypothetical protein